MVTPFNRCNSLIQIPSTSEVPPSILLPCFGPSFPQRGTAQDPSFFSRRAVIPDAHAPFFVRDLPDLFNRTSGFSYDHDKKFPYFPLAVPQR